LLVADSDPPPAPLIQLAAQRGLALRRLRPDDDLPGLLETTRPTLLAWDLAAQEVAAWSIVRAIQAHPQLNQLPLLLYHHAPDGAAPAAATISTGVLLKPAGDSALVGAITNLSPRTAGTILIVEDDPQTRALHRRLIAERLPGYQIRDVADGRVALDVLAEHTPTLVVLDLAMPDVDGFAVLAALRAQPRTAGVPVLVLSGRVLTPDDIARLVEARVIFQTKDVLSEGELADSLRRTVARDTLLPPPTSALVKQAIAFIQQHYSEPLSRQEIAGALNVSKDYLGRIFHQELGLSPWEYLIRYRVLRAKELLWTTSATIAEVARQVGFDNAAYFSHIFQRETGSSPRAFRRQITG
jgi:AraC-like DNA-binding protein